MDRNPLTYSKLNTLALLGGALASALVARLAGTLSTLVATLILASGAFIAALSALQLWIRQNEIREQHDLQLLRSSRPDGALFESQPASLRARRTREQFERFFLPALTILFWLFSGAALFWLYSRRNTPVPLQLDKLPLALTLLSLVAFLTFILGKYSAGIARHEGLTLLRPSASWLLLSTVASCLALAAATAAWFGFPNFDSYFAAALAATLALSFLETAIQLLLELYRPKLHNQPAHPLYESRLLGLLTQPTSLFQTAAQTLDYQFGFKVSQTWFYQYLEKRFASLLLLQLLIAWSSTSLVTIEPHQQAILERFGAPIPSSPILPPGLHLKLPWPIDRAFLVDTHSVRHFDVGFVPDPALAQNDTLLWTRDHYKVEMNMLVASNQGADSVPQNTPDSERSVPVNLLTVSIPVQYRITNLLHWSRQHGAPEKLLPLLAHREVSQYLLNVDPEEFMSTGRTRSAAELKHLLQLSANLAQLGVEILFVGLQDIHPPVPVADAYEAVIAATQERETRILDALAYQADRLPMATAHASQRIESQHGQSLARRVHAAAQAARFQHQLAAWNASPAVYQTRAYHDALVHAIRPARKFVLSATNTQDQFWFNFEEKLRTDLLDVPVPAPKSKP